MEREAAASRDLQGAPAAIEVRGLRKTYGDIIAVNDVTFSVAPGEIFAFLGPNGAGKSTTINMLCTITSASGGQATVAGLDVATQPQAIRRRIGLVYQQHTLDEQLTAEENLTFHAVLYRVPKRVRAERIRRALELVGLTDRGSDLVTTYSGGMARRLEIARSMLHEPEVLFLDEPTVGLDPQTRTLMWDHILAMRAEAGVTVLFTTHHMHEAEVADRVGIIDHGRVITIATPADLKASMGIDTIQLRTRDDTAALRALVTAGYDATAATDGISIRVADGEGEVGRAIEAIGGGVQFVRIHHPTLDDVFMHYTGRKIREQHGETHSELGRAWVGRR